MILDFWAYTARNNGLLITCRGCCIEGTTTSWWIKCSFFIANYCMCLAWQTFVDIHTTLTNSSDREDKYICIYFTTISWIGWLHKMQKLNTCPFQDSQWKVEPLQQKSISNFTPVWVPLPVSNRGAEFSVNVSSSHLSFAVKKRSGHCFWSCSVTTFLHSWCKTNGYH